MCDSLGCKLKFSVPKETSVIESNHYF